MIVQARRLIQCTAFVLALLGGLPAAVQSAPLAIVNAGFEDTSGQSTFNEFTFGTPVGWGIHDPNGLIHDPDIFPGTLQPNGVEFFNSAAPEGSRVGILFNRGQRDAGEYGFFQTLGDTLQANTRYELNVEVGNIGSGTAVSGEFFDLSGFPGYRIDLLAGNSVIAQDLNSLLIPEAEFLTATLKVDIGAFHANLGEALGIRLVNLNVTPGGGDPENPPDLEVDFDDVRLDATALAIRAPASMSIFALGLGAIFLRRRRHFR